MPLYAYTAYARDGRTQQGQATAANDQELIQQLKARKLLVIEHRVIAQQRLPHKLLVRLLLQLSPLLNSGIVIDRALQILADDGTDPVFCALVQQLRDGVKRGQQLSQALENAGCDDALALTVIRAGEASGQLPEVLLTLEQHYQRQQKLRQEIQSALLYPAMLVIISVLSVLLLAVYVIPNFQELFADRTAALTWNARAIFAFSNFILAYGWTMLTIAVIVLGVGVMAARRSPLVRVWWDRRQLSLPVIGPYWLKIMIAQILTLVAVQLRNGVPLVGALDLAGNAVRNGVIRQRMRDVQNEVRRGRPLSAALRHLPSVPNMVLRYVAIGEETGRLDALCDRAAQQLADTTAQRAKNFTTILGPVVILVMGMVIAFIVLSMLGAVYGLTDLAGT